VIPKVIHYIWFGGNPLPPLAEQCIASWKRCMPDYEIKRWDENNFDVCACDYTSEAYEHGKWAFVSDYARFQILYEEGGVYLDTDVELIKPLDDILEQGPYMGFETDPAPGVNGTVAPGLGLAANPGLGLYKTIIDSYKGDHFVKPNGVFDQTTIVVRTTDILRGLGMREVSGIQEVAGVRLYPKEYFCPQDFLTKETHITENTHSIHHYDASWAGPVTRFKHKVMRAVGPKGVAAFKGLKSKLKGDGR
jgi:hypothetical protein